MTGVRAQAHGLCLGWQFAPALPDPGAPPARPVAVPVAVLLDPGWVAAQRKISQVLSRPARLGALAGALAAVASSAAWLAGLAGPAAAGCGCLAAGGAAGCAGSAWGGRRRLARGIPGQHGPLHAASAARSPDLAA